MLLRRITEHVKAQNWFAVFLDFLIVVIGVFIGIQVANWNSERADRGLRAEYLNQISSDLNSDLDEANEVANLAFRRIAAIDDIIAAAGLEKILREYYSNGEVLKAPVFPDFSFDYPYAHNHTITNLDLFSDTKDTFNSLVSSGHFDLLKNRELVLQIQSYYTLVADIKKRDEAIVDNIRRLDEMRSRHGISIAGRTTLVDLANAVQSDHQLAAEFETYLLHSAIQAIGMLEVQTAAKALLKAIEEAK